MNKHFLAKLGEFFRENKGQLSEFSDDDIKEVMTQARSHAGGKQRAENTAKSMSELAQKDGEWRVFFEQQFAEPPAIIQVLPRPGVYSHPRYGKIKMTPEVIQRFVDNHNNHVYQEQVPIDAEHQGKLAGAMGYFGEMRLIDGGKGGAEADVTWTDRGSQLIASDRFKYFSPEWWDEWTDPAGEKKFSNVLIGGAITTRPFFKDRVLRPLVASDDGYQGGEWSTAIDDEAPVLTLEPMSFAEKEVDDDGEDEKDEKDDSPEEEDTEKKAKKAKKANIDVGDVHVDVPDEFRDFSPEQRKSYAKSGVAMPDGSYPIPDRDALHRAIQAYGRSPDESTKNHIKSRARALGLTSMLPEEWTGGQKHMSEEPTTTASQPDVNDKTKEFVESETKKLTEELETEKGARKAAEDRLLKLETEAQTRKFNDIIMGRDSAGDGSPPMPGKHEIHHRTMTVLAREFGEESDELKEYIEEQRAISKQMREGGLFKEVGVGTGNAGGTGALNTNTLKFNEKVDEWLTAHDGKNRGDAVQAIATSEPKLYMAQLREQEQKAKKASTNYGLDDEEDED